MKWTRGYGRWVRDILVWTKAPFLFRNELVLADSLIAGARPAKPGEVKRLGKHPTVLTVAVEGGARIELASADGPDRALGPFAATSGTGRRPADEQPPVNQLTNSLAVLDLPSWGRGAVGWCHRSMQADMLRILPGGG